MARRKRLASDPGRTPARIDLPFTPVSLKQVLKLGASPETSPYTHWDIAHWCDRFHMTMLDLDLDPAMDSAVQIAADVDAQWEMYLDNTYTFEQLQSLDLSPVQLPVEWFLTWLLELEQTFPAEPPPAP